MPLCSLSVCVVVTAFSHMRVVAMVCNCPVSGLLDTQPPPHHSSSQCECCRPSGPCSPKQVQDLGSRAHVPATAGFGPHLSGMPSGGVPGCQTPGLVFWCSESPWPTLCHFMRLPVGSDGQGKSVSVTNRKIGAWSWVLKGANLKMWASGV